MKISWEHSHQNVKNQTERTLNAAPENYLIQRPRNSSATSLFVLCFRLFQGWIRFAWQKNACQQVDQTRMFLSPFCSSMSRGVDTLPLYVGHRIVCKEKVQLEMRLNTYCPCYVVFLSSWIGYKAVKLLSQWRIHGHRNARLNNSFDNFWGKEDLSVRGECVLCLGWKNEGSWKNEGRKWEAFLRTKTDWWRQHLRSSLTPVIRPHQHAEGYLFIYPASDLNCRPAFCPMPLNF